MFYNFALIIPANTTKDNPVKQTCKLTYGIVRHVAVGFPPGPKGLAHLVINRYDHQIFPTNPDGSFAWDNYTIEFEEEFDLTERPHSLILIGWNEDDTYDHTITVRFEVGGKQWGLPDLLELETPASFSGY